MLKQISLSRAINQQQRVLLQSQDTAASATGYESAWKSLALHIYQASRSDPTLAAVLKDSKVEIRSAPSTPAPSATTTPAPSVPAKAPVTP